MNLEKAKQEFLQYVKQYEGISPKIDLKREHSLRVMKESEGVARSLNLSEEEVELAELIGLLHDIGRFEQIKRYDTFKDLQSIDHGDLGAEILAKDGFLRNFIEDDKFDNIILKAIKNHNKFSIEEGLTEKELLFAKIIRDADKLDIFYEGVTQFWNTEDEKRKIENSDVSPEVLEAFKNKMTIDRKISKTGADGILSFIAFIFDINFEYSLNRIKEQKYVEKIINKIDFKNEEVKEVLEQFCK